MRRRASTFAVAVAGLLAAAAPAASAAPITAPSDPGFSTPGSWTGTTSGCALLCTLSATNPATGGNPGGEALISYATVANVLGTANGSEDITSGSFTWQGSSPATATLHVDRKTGISTLLSLGGSAGAVLQLVDTTAGTTTAVKTLAYTTDTPAWTGADYAVPGSLLVGGHTYRLQIRTSFSALVAVLGGATVAYDNVQLSASHAAPVVGGTVVGTPSQTSVAIGATVDSQGADATYHVEFGTTTSYGSQTSDQTLNGASSPAAISVNTTGLTPATTYHARLVVTNDGGTTYGPDVTFTTASSATPPTPVPSVGSVSATTPDARDADLTAMVDASTVSGATYRFEYGTSTSYGTNSAMVAVPAAGPSGWSVLTKSLSGLLPGTTYHVRVAVLAGGVWTYGADATFTTPAAMKPSISAPSVTAGQTDAQIAASITPHSSDTSWTVEFGTSGSYGTTSTPVVIPAGESPVLAVFNMSGLTAGTDYHFRFVATSADGTTYGNDTVLRTSDSAVPTTVPIVGDIRARILSSTAAALATTVDVNGQLGATYRFEYGTTASYGSQTVEAAVPAAGIDGTSALAASLSGLRASTTYHARAAVKVGGTWTYGNDVTFTTDADGTTVEEGTQDQPADTGARTTTPAVVTAAPQVATPVAKPAAAVPASCRGVVILRRSRGIQVRLDTFVTAGAPLKITPGRKAGRVTRVTIDGRVVKAVIKGRTAYLTAAQLRIGAHSVVVGKGAKAARVTIQAGTCRPTLALWRKGAKTGVVLSVVPGTKAATIALPKAYAAALKRATVTVRVNGATKAIKNTKVIKDAKATTNSVTVAGLPANAVAVRITFPAGTRAPRAAGVRATVTTAAGKVASLRARAR